MGVRHNGQPLSIAATASVQLSQNREWPHVTRATPVRGAIKRTSQQSVDCGDCAAVSVALASLDGVVTSCCGSCCCGALSSSLTSEVTWKDSVCAPRLWLIARRNCSLLYDPLLYPSMHALMRTSFWTLRFVFARRMLIPFLSRAASVILSVGCNILKMRLRFGLFGPSFSGPGFQALRFGPSYSSPAFSTPCDLVGHFPVLHFPRP